MPSPFHAFLSGQKSEWVVAEDQFFVAFLEEQPLAPGHVVVVPKREEDAIFDLSDSELTGMMIFAKKISHALKAKIACQKIGMAALGLQARHAHLHLVPINSPEDLNFTRSRSPAPAAELKQLASELRSVL